LSNGTTYSGAITINKTTTLKFCAIKDGYLTAGTDVVLTWRGIGIPAIDCTFVVDTGNITGAHVTNQVVLYNSIPYVYHNFELTPYTGSTAGTPRGLFLRTPCAYGSLGFICTGSSADSGTYLRTGADTWQWTTDTYSYYVYDSSTAKAYGFNSMSSTFGVFGGTTSGNKTYSTITTSEPIELITRKFCAANGYIYIFGYMYIEGSPWKGYAKINASTGVVTKIRRFTAKEPACIQFDGHYLYSMFDNTIYILDPSIVSVDTIIPPIEVVNSNLACYRSQIPDLFSVLQGDVSSFVVDTNGNGYLIAHVTVNKSGSVYDTNTLFSFGTLFYPDDTKLVSDGTIWREPLQLYVYDNSTWKLSNELYKRIDGTWTKVLL
jgi:hypothetical protein